jgi:predicted DNA-binding transcriptional regulator AlpA
MALIDSQEVADLIGVELETVYQYKTRGKLPTPAFGGRSPLWDRKTIEKWQRERRRSNADTTREN